MEMQFSLDELDKVADAFWQGIGNATVFLFHGNMGAGKTTTISALCRYKGVRDTLSSPTFSIINEYRFTEDGQSKTIYHIDLYRLNDEEEIRQAGVEDCIYSGALCFIEWPERAPALFDNTALHVVLQPVSETVRQIKILTSQQYNSLTLA